MAKNPLIGTWRLAAYEVISPDGNIDYPFGNNPVGYIMYCEDGYMSVVITKPDRPRFATNVLAQVSDKEKVNAFETYHSYCGRYEFRGDSVVHYIEANLLQNWVGTEQKRNCQLKGNTLVLSGPRITAAVPGKVQITWKRVSAI